MIFINETTHFTPEMWEEIAKLSKRIAKFDDMIISSWFRPATIRPWARWAIPATRCQRIRGEK